MIKITDQEFNLLSGLVLQLLGIELDTTKKGLVEARLSSRIRQLKLTSFSEYLNYLDHASSEANYREEIDILINKITTNETSFCRERQHFVALKEEIIPDILKRKRQAMQTGLRIWSAACSSGEEVYSIAINIFDYLDAPTLLGTKILATDVNTEVLTQARQGIYKEVEVTQKMPKHLRLKHFTAISDHYLQINDNIRRLITFKKLNLLEAKYPIKDKVDIIFCRNVLIYFSDDGLKHAINQFHHYLAEDGYLIVGHSENLYQYSDIFRLIGKTVYQKVSNEKEDSNS